MFFDESTGLFSSMKLTCLSADTAAASAPSGKLCVEGDWDGPSKQIDMDAWSDWTDINDTIASMDPVSQSEDIATLQSAADEIYENDLVLEYIPDSPGSDYEWNEEDLRWQLTEAAQEIVSAQASINSMVTSATYMRAVGKLISNPADVDAMAEFTVMQDQIDAWQAIVDGP